MWSEDASSAPSGEGRVFTACVGPYVLSVVTRFDGTSVWSCGEGDAGEWMLVEGIVPDAETAKRAALGEARRRWCLTGVALEKIEAHDVVWPGGSGRPLRTA